MEHNRGAKPYPVHKILSLQFEESRPGKKCIDK